MLWINPGRPAAWPVYSDRIGHWTRRSIDSPDPDWAWVRLVWIVRVTFLILLVLVLFSLVVVNAEMVS